MSYFRRASMKRSTSSAEAGGGETTAPKKRRFHFTRSRKRAVLQVVEPVIKAGFAAFQLATGDGFRRRSFDSLPHDGLNILVVRLDTIGDVLLSEPALRALRDRYPGSHIDLITSPSG